MSEKENLIPKMISNEEFKEKLITKLKNIIYVKPLSFLTAYQNEAKGYRHVFELCTNSSYKLEYENVTAGIPLFRKEYPISKCYITLQDPDTEKRSFSLFTNDSNYKPYDNDPQYYIHDNLPTLAKHSEINIFDDMGSRFFFWVHDNTVCNIYAHNEFSQKENRPIRIDNEPIGLKLNVFRHDKFPLNINFNHPEISYQSHITLNADTLTSRLEFDAINGYSNLAINAKSHSLAVKKLQNSTINFFKSSNNIKIDYMDNSTIRFFDGAYDDINLNVERDKSESYNSCNVYASHSTLKNISMHQGIAIQNIKLEKAKIERLSLFDVKIPNLIEKTTNINLNNSIIHKIDYDKINNPFEAKQTFNLHLINSDHQDLTVFEDMNINTLEITSENKPYDEKLSEFISKANDSKLEIASFVTDQSVILNSQSLSIKANEIKMPLSCFNSKVTLKAENITVPKETIVRNSDLSFDFINEEPEVSTEVKLNGTYKKTALSFSNWNNIAVGDAEINNVEKQIDFKNIVSIQFAGQFTSNQPIKIHCMDFHVFGGANVAINKPSEIHVKDQNGLLLEGNLKLHKDSSVFVNGQKLRTTEADVKKYEHIFCLGQ